MSALSERPLAGQVQLTGRSAIGGRFIDGPTLPAHAFHSLNPGTGENIEPTFHPATDEQVESACLAAWDAFGDFSGTAPSRRARLLETIATEVRDIGELLISTVRAETGLGEERVVAERDRTMDTLRQLADAVRDGRWMEPIIDRGEPNRRPPKADIRRMLQPMGPVAVFGASNFPLAYSVAGGDTASALAVGCPVIFKGHPSHPATSELVARAVMAAVEGCGLPPGTFAYLVAGGPREQAVGSLLVRNPCVRAIGFTGSISGGVALSKLAADRLDPIPVYAEMGSVNPVVMLPGAIEKHGESAAQQLAASITESCGQQCTRPGMIFLHASYAADKFLADLANRMEATGPGTMLSVRLRRNLVGRIERAEAARGVEMLASWDPKLRAERPGPVRAYPVLMRTPAAVFREHIALREEFFGPVAIAVVCASTTDMLRALAMVQGSLTGTIWAEASDEADTRRVHTMMEQRVGRLIYNGVPTGVRVAPAMVHGGPYPATNRPESSAQGPTAIRRWCRPVCFQETPDHLLPPALQASNPLKIERLVNGKASREPTPTKP